MDIPKDWGLTDSEQQALLKVIGKRCLVTGDHPLSGHSGIIVRFEKTPFGVRPVIRLDDGQEGFVLKPEHWQAITGAKQ